MGKGTNSLLDHPAFSMHRCKCVDVQGSGERMPSGLRTAQQEAVPTGPTKGATEARYIKEFCLAGIELYLTLKIRIELYDKKKGQLTSVQTDELLTATVHSLKRPYSTVLSTFVSLYRGKLPFLFVILLYHVVLCCTSCPAIRNGIHFFSQCIKNTVVVALVMS